MRQSANVLLLALTTERADGVYGERHVAFYAISDQGVIRQLPVSFDISDYGSWAWRGNAGVWSWDMVYDSTKESHSQAHRYMLRSWALTPRALQGHTRYTRGRYDPGWTVSGERPRVPKQDPLREFGMKWRWWSG
jgi:hypothetical protein